MAGFKRKNLNPHFTDIFDIFYMTEDKIQYLSQNKHNELKKELAFIKEEKIPTIAKKIDSAKQMGDLSENAEYHAAREEMAWAQSRVKEINGILGNAEIISTDKKDVGMVSIGSKVTVEVNGIKKEYFIVGAQEADPVARKISNESPLGQSFLGKTKGDNIQVRVPSGVQNYKIIDIE